MVEVAKIRYTLDAVIDEVVANPVISQGALAKMFGYSESWMSIVFNSDSFKERLAERKAELTDPVLLLRFQTNQAKADAVASRALDRLMERVDSPVGIANMKTQDLVSMVKLTVAPKAPAPVLNQNNLYVMHIPQAAPTSQSWLENLQGAHPPGASQIIDNSPGG